MTNQEIKDLAHLLTFNLNRDLANTSKTVYEIVEDTLYCHLKVTSQQAQLSNGQPIVTTTSKTLFQANPPTKPGGYWSLQQDIIDSVLYGTGYRVMDISSPKKCQHIWKQYTGLTEKYKYCEHCNEKQVSIGIYE